MLDSWCKLRNWYALRFFWGATGDVCPGMEDADVDMGDRFSPPAFINVIQDLTEAFAL